MSKTVTYQQAGVSIAANARWVKRIQAALHSTYSGRVCSVSGAFAGLFRLDFDAQTNRRSYRKPILVGCADGVGTKVLLGIQAQQLYGLGIDLVAMNVNDLITCGAEPLFFLDYLAVHKLDPDGLLEIIEGVADGCRQAGCALLGGETAEMPDLYAKDHLDLAGFATGVVEAERMLDIQRVSPGDVLIGLPSSGVHSNGFALVRRLIRTHRLRLTRHYAELGETLADALLRPTRIYVAPILRVLRKRAAQRPIAALGHITGGGLPENVERMLPAGCVAEIDPCRWTPPPIFPFLQNLGVARREMFNVFNMGIGFVLAVKPAFVGGVVKELEAAGETPVQIGRIRRGRRGVRLP
jgi:phosphoribosylformylglycinamidine cyclo-ligase